MHYWYDERSAGGLKQKEEEEKEPFPFPRIYEELLRRPFLSIEIPYVFCTGTLCTDRSHLYAPVPANSYECFHVLENRCSLSDLLDADS